MGIEETIKQSMKEALAEAMAGAPRSVCSQHDSLVAAVEEACGHAKTAVANTEAIKRDTDRIPAIELSQQNLRAEFSEHLGEHRGVEKTEKKVGQQRAVDVKKQAVNWSKVGAVAKWIAVGGGILGWLGQVVWHYATMRGGG